MGKCRHHNTTPTMSKYVAIAVAIILLCSECIPILAASSTPSISTSITSSKSNHKSESPFNTNTVANFFFRHRCGSSNFQDSPTLWSYEGTLTDPTSGKVIADVEGLELVKSLPPIEPSDYNNSNVQSILNRLSAKKILYPQINKDLPNQQWDSAVTILSRRLFCYRRPSSSRTGNRDTHATNSPYKSLLTSVRLRPDGPLRHLTPSESIAIYDSAVTYISRNNGREMVVFSERLPNDTENEDSTKKHYVMGSAQRTLSSSIDDQSLIFGYSIHGQKGGSNSNLILPPLKLNTAEEVVISPPRSRFLQFGKGTMNASERKYGSVRETYTYTIDNDLQENANSSGSSEINSNRQGHRRRYRRNRPSFSGKMNQISQIKKQIKENKTSEQEEEPPVQCLVRYTRYGEAPPWYAPGRSCTLELKGKRNNNDTTNNQMPELASWVASKCNFWSGWPSTFTTNNGDSGSTDNTGKESEADIARNAVELFCREGKPSTKPLEEDWPIAERNRLVSSADNALSRMQLFIRRLSKSVIVSEIPTSGSGII